jgi:DNA-binding ferritin-like protein (Dps family)
MMTNWIEAITGSLEQKKQYRQYKARRDALPAGYRTAAEAVDRYLTYYGGIVDGDTIMTMLGDLIDLWEQAAADGTSVRAIVGDDPVGFVETFAQSYGGRHWIDKERARLIAAIEDASRATP